MVAHTRHKLKSWILNYPALACMLNGATCRLCRYARHHEVTCDAFQNMGGVGMYLASLVGTHVEQLAQWSCEMERDSIINRGGQGKWMK